MYTNNTCVLGTSTTAQGFHTDPIGLDTYPYAGRGFGFVCHLNFSNATARKYTARAARNRYFTALGDFAFACPDNSTKGVAPVNRTLRDLQHVGWEEGSSVRPRSAFPASAVIGMARELLGLASSKGL